MQPLEFLRQYHPFSELEADALERVGGSLEIVFTPAGETVLTEGGAVADAVGVIRKGALELVTGDVLVDQLEPGDTFGFLSAMSKQPPSMTVRAVEDTLSYLIPADVARRVFGGPSGVATVWAIARQRIRAADAVARSARAADPRFARIGSLVRRPLVTADPSITVAEAATVMRDARVSSLVLQGGATEAIVTDRDLRSKVVAARGSFDGAALGVATQPVLRAPASMPAGEAILMMLAKGIHHLPVDEDGRLIGVVTDTDLMGLEDGNAFSMRGAIDRAATVDAVIDATRTYPRVVAALVDAGTDPIDVCRIVAIIIEAATERLVKLACDELGDAPCAFGWVALGSAARREPALDADQDHALALGPGFDPDEHDAYFRALAERVTAGLEAIGFPRCHGDAMAVHSAMRAPLTTWQERFRTWIRQPDADGMILSSIGFDFRTVAGSLPADDALDAAVAEARTNPGFARLLTKGALRHEPPTGFVRHLVVASKGEHRGTLDLKHGGVTIITSIARARAVAAGATAKDTLGRLAAAARGGTLDPLSATELDEAFRFLLDLRLRHQAAQVRADVTVDDFVDPHDLGSIERSGLREAFRAIRREQQALAVEVDAR
ncbi:MAG TPA: putative nucleotidyltransferase substrate binding domain-containing protein [Actinomycetota bacterium]|nr:putative nucleotidyltransferase substrate binding domain-containing protein [Actinomycetota bacterium]